MILSRLNRLWYSYTRLSLIFLASVLSPFATAATTAAAVGPGADDKRSIAFYHTHTGERLEVVYYSAGHYQQTALDQINYFLRDFRTGDMATVDPDTIDIVHAVQQRAGHQGAVHIVSAYRSKKTNEMLRSKGTGVARKSQHIEARAIDFRLPGVDTAAIRDIARALKRGGVGYYQKSDFIHVDSGRVRFW